MICSCASGITKRFSWVNENTSIKERNADTEKCDINSAELAGEKPRKEPEFIFRPSIGRGLVGAGGRQRNRIALEGWENKKESHYEECMIQEGYIKIEIHER